MKEPTDDAAATDQQGPPLISSWSLDSIRYLGLTTTDAVCELIDNSLDAGAENIHVHILTGPEGTGIAVEDDGEGIPSEKVAQVLSFGGRVEREGRRAIGRFGWGLPSSACCQAPRTELYSRVKGGDWYTSHIDIRELSKMDQARLPLPGRKTPPASLPLKLNGSPSGTVVWLRGCDRLESSIPSALEALLIKSLAKTYRRYLNAGRKIWVGSVPITKADPLMLMPGCWLQDKAGSGKEFQTIAPIIVDPDVIDSITGKPAEIGIKIVLLDWEHIRNEPDSETIKGQIGINVEHQGFYLMRHDRQIGEALSLWLYTKHNDFNYFRGEISFPPELDGYFGVQTNKSRFAIDRRLRDEMAERLKGVFGGMRKVYNDWLKESEKKAVTPGLTKSEEAAAKGESLLKSSLFPVDQAQVEAVRKEKAQEKAAMLAKVTTDASLTPEQRTREVARIENMFQFVRPFRRAIEASESGNFYVLRPKGNETTVVINMNHPFYKKVYEKAVVSGMDTQLDLILFALAKAEYIAYDNEKYVKFYELQKKEWSTILSVYLEEFQEEEAEG